MVRRINPSRWRFAWMVWILWIGGLSLGGVGCREPEPQPFHLQLVSIDPHGGPMLPDDRVHAIVRRSLERSPSFIPAERDQRSGRRKDTLMATLEYRELPDATDHGRDLLVRLAVQPPEHLVSRLGSQGLDITVLLEREAGEADLAADLQLATDRLAAILQARTDLAIGTSGTVERLLDAPDSDLVSLTLEWVREHADDPEALGAADQVAVLINHPDQEVGLLAIETIGPIGGPQHVSAVLQRIQLSDSTQASRAYDAIAHLGGPEAAGFLEFAARNEDEPERRRAAERALARMVDLELSSSEEFGGPSGRFGRSGPSLPGSRRIPNRGHR